MPYNTQTQKVGKTLHCVYCGKAVAVTRLVDKDYCFCTCDTAEQEIAMHMAVDALKAGYELIPNTEMLSNLILRSMLEEADQMDEKRMAYNKALAQLEEKFDEDKKALKELYSIDDES